jgi:hypothetical protein
MASRKEAGTDRQAVEYGDQQVERGHGGETQARHDRAGRPAAVRDFVADAYAHCKFIGYTGDASPLFEAAGLSGPTDDGFVSLDEHSAADFISRCAKLRFWPRQASIARRAGTARASAG